MEINGQRQRFLYVFYTVINRGSKPLHFAPHFTLVTDTKNRYDDVNFPKAVRSIQAREDPTIDLLGTAGAKGMLPPSGNDRVDNAVYGVAVWEDLDPNATAYQVSVRGLSNERREAKSPENPKSIVAKYKTLKTELSRQRNPRQADQKEF